MTKAIGRGTAFIEHSAAPWRSPCAACGRYKPARFALIFSPDAAEGRRKLIRCPNHHIREGVELQTLRCEITGEGAIGWEYQVRERLAMTNPPPTHPEGRQHVGAGSCGITRAYFLECVERGRIEVL